MHTNRDQSLVEVTPDARPGGPREAPTCLGELKLRDVELLHDLVPEHVGGGKQPTPPAALLVSPRASLEVNDVVEDMLVGDLGSTVQ